MLNRISKKSAGLGIIATNIFTIAIFLTVILKILPFNCISGGRLADYSAAFQTAILSILIISWGLPLVALASELIKVNQFKLFFRVWLFLSFLLLAFFIYKIQIIAIVLMCLGMPLIAIASGLDNFKRFKVLFKVWLWVSVLLNCLNILGNLLGATLATDKNFIVQ